MKWYYDYCNFPPLVKFFLGKWKGTCERRYSVMYVQTHRQSMKILKQWKLNVEIWNHLFIYIIEPQNKKFQSKAALSVRIDLCLAMLQLVFIGLTNPKTHFTPIGKWKFKEKLNQSYFGTCIMNIPIAPKPSLLLLWRYASNLFIVADRRLFRGH